MMTEEARREFFLMRAEIREAFQSIKTELAQVKEQIRSLVRAPEEGDDPRSAGGPGSSRHV